MANTEIASISIADFDQWRKRTWEILDHGQQGYVGF